MKSIAILMFVTLTFHSVMSDPDCSGKESTAAENEIFYCAFPDVLRGKLVNVEDANTAINVGEDRTFTFTVSQVYKGGYKDNKPTTLNVKYIRMTINCPEKPFDDAGLENIIYGFANKNDNSISIMNCESVKVFDCLDENDMATFNGFSTNNPCDNGGFPGM